MLKRCLQLAVILIPLTGCLEQPGSSPSLGTIPDLTVECSSAMVFNPFCRGLVSEKIWVGLTSDFDLDCPAVLASFSGSTRNSYFEAIATSTAFSHNGGLTQVSISSWTTPLGASLGNLTRGSYKACAFIEQTGGNDRLGAGEPLGAAVVQVGGSSPQLVNDWTTY